jgi:hypothetical protein
MLYWEAEDPALAEVHHLMVLCYHLQHPGLHSREGLHQAVALLSDFVEGGVSPAEIRRRNRIRVASQNRKWKVKASGTDRGSYQHEVHWAVVARDIVAAGQQNYVESVRKWAEAVLENLKVTGNF